MVSVVSRDLLPASVQAALADLRVLVVLEGAADLEAGAPADSTTHLGSA